MARSRKADTPVGNVVSLVRRSPAPSAKLVLPRRTKAHAARIDFPLLEDDLERVQANARGGIMAFQMVHDQLELLSITERRTGVSTEARRTLLAQIYAALNNASRMMNPYRRPRG